MTAATLQKVVVTLTGWTGAPGYAVHYLDTISGGLAAVTTFWTGVRAYIPSEVTISIPNSGDLISDDTGHLAGSWTGTGGGTVNGSASGGFSAQNGACVTWNTGATVTGPSGRPRRLRGRTFLVPLAFNAFDVDGTLTAAALSTFLTEGTNYAAAGHGQVWHRPWPSGASNGSSSPITSATVRDHGAVLTSRRR